MPKLKPSSDFTKSEEIQLNSFLKNPWFWIWLSTCVLVISTIVAHEYGRFRTEAQVLLEIRKYCNGPSSQDSNPSGSVNSQFDKIPSDPYTIDFKTDASQM